MTSFIIIISVFASLIIGVNVFNHTMGYDDDNKYEEIIEEGLEEMTGYDVDLTPQSPEKQ